MKRLTLFFFSMVLMAASAAFVAPALAQHEHEHPAGDPGKLGKVNFPVSCDPAVQVQFSTAVAMLHSFWYEKASDTFARVAEKDPVCGMAYWGIAMTYYHPIWEAPGPAARYAVERHRWSEAAALAMPANTFPRERYAWTEANLHFARALGASHTGDTEAAQKDLNDLAAIEVLLTQENNKYWADQVSIQREIAAAWITLAAGKPEDALQQMRSAADHEDKTDKHNVTPGVILPARELLGEMLLELKQPAKATIEFEATLRTAPNRFNALSGAARAAKLSGDREKAKGYYTKLLAICSRSEGYRPELEEARLLLSQK